MDRYEIATGRKHSELHLLINMTDIGNTLFSLIVECTDFV
jgi:hypothetical protein